LCDRKEITDLMHFHERRAPAYMVILRRRCPCATDRQTP
jgi:hypothetical protein